MAKTQVSIRLPANTEQQVARYKHEEGIEHDSEAAKQLIEAGVEAQQESGPGERLAESAVSISAVGAGVAAIGAAWGSTWAWGVLMPFMTATFVFALLLASIRVLAGKDLA